MEDVDPNLLKIKQYYTTMHTPSPRCPHSPPCHIVAPQPVELWNRILAPLKPGEPKSNRRTVHTISAEPASQLAGYVKLGEADGNVHTHGRTTSLETQSINRVPSCFGSDSSGQNFAKNALELDETIVHLDCSPYWKQQTFPAQDAFRDSVGPRVEIDLNSLSPHEIDFMTKSDGFTAEKFEYNIGEMGMPMGLLNSLGVVTMYPAGRVLMQPFVLNYGDPVLERGLPRAFDPQRSGPMVPVPLSLAPTSAPVQRAPTFCAYCPESFTRPSDSQRHYESFQLGIRHHCCLNCGNKRGNGYARAVKLKAHLEKFMVSLKSRYDNLVNTKKWRSGAALATAMSLFLWCCLLNVLMRGCVC
ncbi:uncharacterized protein RSE6_10974 [Rhynchosporium secalis]|uniref:Uncharacterized protein n=1 Tax=Rhynchosporium secalis TaxID=38038 RepID=A0A1E1MLU8_RHYSE|nr:uncharacterized protein RSE6_10974 [Rhynchosporium secalis]